MLQEFFDIAVDGPLHMEVVGFVAFGYDVQCDRAADGGYSLSDPVIRRRGILWQVFGCIENSIVVRRRLHIDDEQFYAKRFFQFRKLIRILIPANPVIRSVYVIKPFYIIEWPVYPGVINRVAARDHCQSFFGNICIAHPRVVGKDGRIQENVVRETLRQFYGVCRNLYECSVLEQGGFSVPMFCRSLAQGGRSQLCTDDFFVMELRLSFCHQFLHLLKGLIDIGGPFNAGICRFHCL